MVLEAKSKYKSWSNLKKQMNDLLCESLKDRISYFYTNYKSVHHTYGRASINLDKKEMVSFSWDIGLLQWDDECRVLDEFNVSAQSLGGVQLVKAKQTEVRENLMKSKWMPECKLCNVDFINAITEYLNTDIVTSICSDNYLLRVFAYMDRRVGKRTLIKIKDEIETLPDWVQQFYNLRCDADDIKL